MLSKSHSPFDVRSLRALKAAAAQKQMLWLGRKTAKEKIVSFRLDLSERALRRGQTGNPVAVTLCRNDIGDDLGLTTGTVSRTFTHVKGAGLIGLQPGGKVLLTDVEALQGIADGM